MVLMFGCTIAGESLLGEMCLVSWLLLVLMLWVSMTYHICYCSSRWLGGTRMGHGGTYREPRIGCTRVEWICNAAPRLAEGEATRMTVEGRTFAD